MIIAFNDDTTVSVWRELGDVQREYEGIDVESGPVAFYSEDGVWLEPVFVKPNRRGKLLFIIPWVESGIFRLEPRPERVDRPIWRAFSDHPNPRELGEFRSLGELRAHLAARGVVVEPPPEWAPENSSGPA